MTLALHVECHQESSAIEIFPAIGAINLINNAFLKALLPGQEKEVRRQSSSTTDAFRRTTGGTAPVLTSL